jgi:hypothetical protein
MNRFVNIFRVPALVVLAVLYFENQHRAWVRPVLMVYAMVLLVTAQVLSVSRNGAEVLFKERWMIIGAALLVIETANQIAYYKARKNYSAASRLKALIFWITFTCAMFIYIWFLVNSAPNFTWSTKRMVLLGLGSVALSWSAPWYSFCPRIRFLAVYGGFQKL